MQLSDAAAAAERVRQMSANPKAFAPPNPALGPGLGAQHGEAGLGRQFVQPTLDGVLMDDLIGHAFALVGTRSVLGDDGWARGLAQRYPRLKTICLPDTQEDAFAPYSASAVILRPDRYVHASASTREALLRELDGLGGLLK